MSRQARDWLGKTGPAMVDYSCTALTSINGSGVTLQAAGEDAFQIAPSA